MTNRKAHFDALRKQIDSGRLAVGKMPDFFVSGVEVHSTVLRLFRAELSDAARSLRGVSKPLQTYPDAYCGYCIYRGRRNRKRYWLEITLPSDQRLFYLSNRRYPAFHFYASGVVDESAMEEATRVVRRFSCRAVVTGADNLLVAAWREAEQIGLAIYPAPQNDMLWGDKQLQKKIDATFLPGAQSIVRRRGL